MADTADAVVIGAGVIGSSVALELARSGRDVLVVDKGPGPGTGSTAASSACVRFHYSTWEGVVTSWEAKHAWERWADHLGAIDPIGMADYVRTGVLVLDFPGFKADRVVGLYNKIGIPVEELSPDEIRSRFPGLDTGRYFPPKSLADDGFWSDASGELCAWYTPEGGFVNDPQLSAHNLMHAAAVHGATPVYNVAVAEIARGGGRVESVRLSDGTRVSTPLVVNAAGPHSAVVNDLAGVLDEFRIRTRPLRQEVHHVDGSGLNGELTGLPMVADGDLGTYFRRHAGGSLLIGGQEPECDELVWLDDPERYDANPTAPAFDAQVTRVGRRLTALQVPPRPRGIVGVYDVSDDWIPVYDRTSVDGYYVAIGT